MNNKAAIRLSALGLAFSLYACDPEQQTAEEQTVALEGSNWQLQRIQVPGGFVFEADDPGKYVLNFRSENRLTGRSDCNDLNGAWQQNGNTLQFQPFSSTRNMCPPGSLHNHLVLYLPQVDAIEFAQGQLSMSTPQEGVELLFTARE